MNEATNSLERYEKNDLEGNTGMTVTLDEELQCHSRGIKFDGDKHKLLNSELKKLYTAVTRARVNIWIYDEDIKKRAPMFEYFIKQNLVYVCKVNGDDLPRELDLRRNPHLKNGARKQYIFMINSYGS